MTKKFVEAASFILSATVGGPGKKGASKAKPIKRTTEPLWDTKQFAKEQFFSQTAYLNVKEIAGNRVTVDNSYGSTLYVSKDILEGMHSASHFKKEVPMNMTGLAELLQSVQDHVFTVTFKRQPTEDNATELIKKADMATLADKSKLSKLAKDVISGSDCTMICHMVEVENNLGRSLVIDLTAKGPSKFRQIDHRSIESIIFQNHKFLLKKGAKSEDFDLDEARKAEKG